MADQDQHKVTVKNADMSEEMQQKMIDLAFHALQHYENEQDMARFIKKECDKNH